MTPEFGLGGAPHSPCASRAEVLRRGVACDGSRCSRPCGLKQVGSLVAAAPHTRCHCCRPSPQPSPREGRGEGENLSPRFGVGLLSSCLVAARGADPEAILLVAARCKSGVLHARLAAPAWGKLPGQRLSNAAGRPQILLGQRHKCFLPNSDYPRA
jgi:hypothetical protein